MLYDFWLWIAVRQPLWRAQVCYEGATARQSNAERGNGEPTGLRNPTALPQGRARGSPFQHLMPCENLARNGLVISIFRRKPLVNGFIWQSLNLPTDGGLHRDSASQGDLFQFFSLYPLARDSGKRTNGSDRTALQMPAGGLLSPLASETRSSPSTGRRARLSNPFYSPTCQPCLWLTVTVAKPPSSSASPRLCVNQSRRSRNLQPGPA
jgi:hypothetical protein